MINNNLIINFQPGKLAVLLGPNGSGKSTLARKILEKDKLSGKVFLGFQQPVSVPGVSYLDLLKAASKTKLDPLKFYEFLKEKAKLLEIPEEFLSRDLNLNFSGGEKKKMEVFQALVLQPKFAIFDEPDSGVDARNLKLIIKAIQSLQKQGTGVLVITHNANLVKTLKPWKKYAISQDD